MRFAHAIRAFAALAVAAAALPASAAECYMIVDRGNEVLYQGLTSPVDLSTEGQAARDAMRRRGEQLVVLDTDRCPPIDRLHVTGNGQPASVEEIVSGMRPAVSFGRRGEAPRAPGSENGAGVPRIRVPVATGGAASAGGLPSGMSIR